MTIYSQKLTENGTRYKQAVKFAPICCAVESWDEGATRRYRDSRLASQPRSVPQRRSDKERGFSCLVWSYDVIITSQSAETCSPSRVSWVGNAVTCSQIERRWVLHHSTWIILLQLGCLPGLQGLEWANYVVGSIICGSSDLYFSVTVVINMTSLVLQTLQQVFSM